MRPALEKDDCDLPRDASIPSPARLAPGQLFDWLAIGIGIGFSAQVTRHTWLPLVIRRSSSRGRARGQMAPGANDSHPLRLRTTGRGVQATETDIAVIPRACQ